MGAKKRISCCAHLLSGAMTKSYEISGENIYNNVYENAGFDGTEKNCNNRVSDMIATRFPLRSLGSGAWVITKRTFRHNCMSK